MNNIIKLNDNWKPSTFFNSNTNLEWILNYKLFEKIYNNKLTPNKDIKYAIHKDVFDAFLLKLKMNKERNKTKKSNRKSMKKYNIKNISKKIKKYTRKNNKN